MTRRETITALSRLRAFCERPDVSDRAVRVLVMATLSVTERRLRRPRRRTERLGPIVADALKKINVLDDGDAPPC